MIRARSPLAARRAVALAAAVCAACASTLPQTHVDPNAPDLAASELEARADAFWRSLQSHALAEATARFSATLRAQVSSAQFATAWTGLEGQFGVFTAWSVTSRSNKDGVVVLQQELRFERLHRDHFLNAVMSVQVKTGEITGLALSPAAPRPTPPPPADAPFTAEEVHFGNAPWILPGTLTLPKSTAGAPAGPRPAVLLLGSSGAEDRDESVGANKPARDIAEALASQGVVVLRYDKRAFVYPAKMDRRTQTISDELIDDGIAAITYLQGRPEVDKAKVFIAGHGLAASVTAEVARPRMPIAGLILLAPPARHPLQVLANQLRYLGAPAEQAQALEKVDRQLTMRQFNPEDFVLGAPVSYWDDLEKRNEIAIARSLGIAALILRGDRDFQILDSDVHGWVRGLDGGSRVQQQTFPGLNHLFMTGVGRPGPQEYDTAGEVDAVVIARIRKFIASQQE